MTKDRFSGVPSTGQANSTLRAKLEFGLALHQQGRIGEAAKIYEEILRFDKNHCDALHLIGVLYSQTGRHEQAVDFMSKAIKLNPTAAAIYNNCGISLKELKRFDGALASFSKAIKLKPNFAEAYNNRGTILIDLKRLEEAIISFNKAIELKPNYAEAYYNRGNALNDLNRFDEALAGYNRALELKTNYAEAYNNRGISLSKLKRLDQAIASFNKAIELKRDFADAYNNRGSALNDLKRREEAIVSFNKAIEHKPDHAEAYSNRSNALNELRRFSEALASSDTAIKIKPDYAEAYNQRGVALKGLKHLDDALACYEKAILLKPEFSDALSNRGHALEELKRLDEALASYEKALLLKPDYEFLFGNYVHTKMKVCDWGMLREDLAKITGEIVQANKITVPFPLLGLIDNPALQKAAAQVYCAATCPRSGALKPFSGATSREKIRIGYYSSDFRNHATSYLIAELLEEHDADRFELYGFSFGPEQRDAMWGRVFATFDKFIDVGRKSDEEIAKLSRELGIDIAVDLKGYTADSRPAIFAEGCAPIQINFLGYPGTMGANYMDYLIADKIVIPVESEAAYTEKIVRLPFSYQPNDSKRKISDKIFTRPAVGLPKTGFVFCCFNNNYKILPETFESWTTILKAVEGSVLWLLEDNPLAALNLRKEATARGLDADRLVFAERLPLDEHLSRHRLADLFLDTWPYNAHTTASDALWAGLPVVTRTGTSFASRVAASLLTAVGLPELITGSQEDYEALATKLASNSVNLAGIRKKLENNRATAPLFNGKQFARHLEAAYEAIYGHHQAGLPPRHFEVFPHS